MQKSDTIPVSSLSITNASLAPPEFAVLIAALSSWEAPAGIKAEAVYRTDRNRIDITLAPSDARYPETTVLYSFYDFNVPNDLWRLDEGAENVLHSVWEADARVALERVPVLEAENKTLRAFHAMILSLVETIIEMEPHEDKPQPYLEALLDKVMEVKELRAEVVRLKEELATGIPKVRSM